MHADGKSTLVSVSKWNSRKVNSERSTPTILDEIVGTFSYVFFKVLKNFHNQELT